MSTYPPQECGIATFTYDLVNAIDNYSPFFETQVIVMKEKNEENNFDGKVVFEIRESEPEDYLIAANYVNESDINVVSIQHEFGIFGGKDGEYLKIFLENVKKPIVTTLHTVLLQPNETQKEIIQKIAKKSDKLVVLSNTAVEILNSYYNISREKIVVIHHGVTLYNSLSKEEAKFKLGISGKIVMSTFGLINPGKGIEYVIEAIPMLREIYPNIIYLILGEAHPKVRRFYGEDYREKLISRVKALNIEDNVRFVNRYLTKEELFEYLIATDIYITPYLNREQICSGTLAYAIGFGKVVVSTPYLYAEEILKDGRGIIVNFRDSNAIFRSIDNLLKNPELMRNIEKKALEFGKKMRWSYVASQYVKLFKSLVELPNTIEILN